MVIYLACIVLIVFAFRCLNSQKALKISFLMLAVIAALRKYTVGVDTYQFYRMFTYIGAVPSWDYQVTRYEPGFFYLCKLLYMVCKDGQILIIVSSIFINYAAYRFIKENSNGCCYSTILYVCMNIFFSNMNVMRQAIASSILILGFNLLKEKKYFRYIIVVLIATAFHKVAIAALLIVIFMVLPDKKFTYCLEVVLAVVTFIFGRKFFFLLSRFFGHTGYADSEFGVSNYFGSLIAACEVLVVAGVLMALAFNGSGKYAEKFIENKLLIVICVLYIWFSFLVVRMNIFNRIAGLFSIYSVVLFPKLLGYLKERNSNNYKVMSLAVPGIYFASFIVINIMRPEWYGVIPYTFFWN